VTIWVKATITSSPRNVEPRVAEADRHVEVRDRVVEPGQRRVVQPPAAARLRVGRQIDPHAAVAPRPFRFLHRHVGIGEVDVRHRHQPLAVVGAEIHDVAVVGAGEGGGDLGVLHVAFPEDADGGVEQGDVDLLLVQHLDPLGRVVAAGDQAVLVGARAGGEQRHQVVLHAHAAQGAQHAVEDPQRLAVDHQGFLAGAVPRDVDCAVAIVRFEVLEPEILRLEHMAVGVHHHPVHRFLRPVAVSGRFSSAGPFQAASPRRWDRLGGRSGRAVKQLAGGMRAGRFRRAT
jgi:hypothetical protein